MSQASTARRTAGVLTAVVLVLLPATAVRYALYEPNPAVWHETSVGPGVNTDREIAVTVERGWSEDLGRRITGDLWVKYGGSVHVEFRCVVGAPSSRAWLGVGLHTDRRGTAVVPNPGGVCP